MYLEPQVRPGRRRSNLHILFIRARWMLRYLRREEILRRRRQREARDWMPNCYYLDY